MTNRNFEGRRFGDEFQARSLAEWIHGDVLWSEDRITPRAIAEGSPRQYALHGDWIIRRAGDTTVRIEGGGSQDGYCTDCGEPVWWHVESLVTRDGRRWCYGPDRERVTMTHHHVLPDMPQYVVPAPEGQVCHCLARSCAHIHHITLVPDLGAL